MMSRFYLSASRVWPTPTYGVSCIACKESTRRSCHREKCNHGHSEIEKRYRLFVRVATGLPINPTSRKTNRGQREGWRTCLGTKINKKQTKDEVRMKNINLNRLYL